ncbi:MAG: low molecular weight protein-tyrosine-phosphatase [Phycisphaerales bacterium]
MSGGSNQPTRVLFVCLGNICRSPLAKFVAVAMAERRGLSGRVEFDSCGTGGWHVGGGADPRTVAVARRHGLETTHTARQLSHQDFGRFHWLIAMDADNVQTLLNRGAPPEKVRLMRSFDAAASAEAPDLDVPDPYTGGPEGFDEVYSMLVTACEGMLDELLR